jgi:hypothetical protein
MEIEFNPNNVGRPDPVPPAARQDVVRSVPDDAPFQKVAALEDKLREVPLIRHENVERAKGLVSNLKYPPDDILNGIANLLAMQIKSL